MRIPFLFLVLISLAALATDPGPSKYERWIQELGDRSYAVRQRAQKDLVAAGLPALASLEKAANHPDPETRNRVDTAIRRIHQTIKLREIAPWSEYAVTDFGPSALAGAKWKKGDRLELETGQLGHGATPFKVTVDFQAETDLTVTLRAEARLKPMSFQGVFLPPPEHRLVVLRAIYSKANPDDLPSLEDDAGKAILRVGKPLLQELSLTQKEGQDHSFSGPNGVIRISFPPKPGLAKADRVETDTFYVAVIKPAEINP